MLIRPGQDVQDPVDPDKSRSLLFARQLPDTRWTFPQSVAGPPEAFVDISFAGKQTQGDLACAESAKGLEREHQLRISRNCVIAADKQHSQQIVSHFPGQQTLRFGRPYSCRKKFSTGLRALKVR